MVKEKYITEERFESYKENSVVFNVIISTMIVGFGMIVLYGMIEDTPQGYEYEEVCVDEYPYILTYYSDAVPILAEREYKVLIEEDTADGSINYKDTLTIEMRSSSEEECEFLSGTPFEVSEGYRRSFRINDYCRYECTKYEMRLVKNV